MVLPHAAMKATFWCAHSNQKPGKPIQDNQTEKRTINIIIIYKTALHKMLILCSMPSQKPKQEQGSRFTRTRSKTKPDVCCEHRRAILMSEQLTSFTNKLTI
jgi:hypothetical protein